MNRLAPDRTATGRRQTSAWHVITAGVGATIVLIGAYGSRDPDVFWHRVLGETWLDNLNFDLSPDPIAFTPGRSWFTTSWSPEVLYALIVRQFGYEGMLGLRFALAVTFATVLCLGLRARHTPWTATVVIAAVGLPAALSIEDRPQTISLILVAAAIPAIRRFLFEDRLPGATLIVAYTWVWANIHGLWVLVPALLLLSAFCRAVERKPTWRGPVILSCAAMIVAALTPIGPKLLLAPYRVGSSSQQISEWQPTNLRNADAWGLALVVVALLVLWARSQRPVASRQIIFLLAWGLYGAVANRNAVIASLILSPVLLHWLQSALPGTASSIRVPKALVYVLCAVAVPLTAVEYSQQSWRPSDSPVRIAQHLHDEQRDIRLVNPYNVAGYLREFGGDRVRVAIDGRSDRYGDTRIRAYNKMMLAQGNWRPLFQSLRPDAVVAERGSPLVPLIEQRGWQRVMTSNGFVLLEQR